VYVSRQDLKDERRIINATSKVPAPLEKLRDTVRFVFNVIRESILENQKSLVVFVVVLVLVLMLVVVVVYS
jgi:hypothetical protein